MKVTTQHLQPIKPDPEDKHLPKLKRKRSNPRQKFRQRIRGFLPLKIEQKNPPQFDQIRLTLQRTNKVNKDGSVSKKMITEVIKKAMAQPVLACVKLTRRSRYWRSQGVQRLPN